jgi:hypothetical protein
MSPDGEPGIIIVCSYTRDDGYYYPQSFDKSDRDLTDDRNVPIWPTVAPERTDVPPDSLNGIAPGPPGPPGPG